MDWNACNLEPNHILRWMECRPGFAAYVQAIGSILAIGAGAWGVIWQQAKVKTLAQEAADNAQREKEAKRNALAYRLDLLVDDIKAHHDMVMSSLHVHEGGLSLISQARLDDAIKVMKINVAWGDDLFNDMSVMPRPIQEAVTTLLYIVANYNRETEGALRHAAKHGLHTIIDLPDQERGMLDQIAYRMNEASGLLEASLAADVQ